jgi:hypothetical protein
LCEASHERAKRSFVVKGKRGSRAARNGDDRVGGKHPETRPAQTVSGGAAISTEI